MSFKAAITSKRTFKLTITIVSVFAIFQIASVSVDKNGDYDDIFDGSFSGNDARLAKIIRERYLSPPSSLPYNLSTDPNYNKYSKSATWPYIHHYLKQFFEDQRNGFFIEAGALDGEFLSNSLWLEQTLGWNGILVEPDKSSYQQLLMKRRKAWSSNTCLSSTMYPKVIVHAAVRLNNLYHGIQWYYRGASHEVGVTIHPKYDQFFEISDTSYEVVHCFPLVSYLRALNVTTVDYLSLDIQGREKEVLMTFPWKEFLIRLIIVELSEDDREKGDSTLVDFMIGLGYLWLNKNERNITEDVILVRKEEINGQTTKNFTESNNTI